MSDRPLISIITVNLNNLPGLEKTMNSVFEQEYKEFEYIVIDGGSTDGSKGFIEKHNEKIDYWVSEPDKGIYNGMNKGIMAASGKFLLFLNSGDRFFSNKVLKENYQFLTHDLVYFDIKVRDTAGSKTFTKNYPERLSFSYFIKDSLPHPGTFIKSQLFEQVGLYDERLKIVSDWKFFIIALSKFNVNYRHVKDILTTFTLDGISSHSSNWPVILEERQSVLNNEFKFFLEDYNSISQLENKLSTLKNSKKIKWMVRLGLLNRF